MQLRYAIDPGLRAADYMDLLRQGWRRFGPIVFRPECPSCRMCQSLRVPVSAFRASASQRRVWKTNQDVAIRIGAPSVTPEKRDLFVRFHQHGQETKGWPTDGGVDLDLFVQNPFATEEWGYYLGDRLVAVGYVDALPDGLSAIYCYHDPVAGRRSLGTYNILAMIAGAAARGLPHVYLGYYVAGCRSLEYKARFCPNEVLGPDGGWQAFRPLARSTRTI